MLTAIGLAPGRCARHASPEPGAPDHGEEIDFALETIPPVIERLRQLSRYKKPVIA